MPSRAFSPMALSAGALAGVHGLALSVDAVRVGLAPDALGVDPFKTRRPSLDVFGALERTACPSAVCWGPFCCPLPTLWVVLTPAWGSPLQFTLNQCSRWHRLHRGPFMLLPLVEFHRPVVLVGRTQNPPHGVAIRAQLASGNRCSSVGPSLLAHLFLDRSLELVAGLAQGAHPVLLGHGLHGAVAFPPAVLGGLACG